MGLNDGDGFLFIRANDQPERDIKYEITSTDSTCSLDLSGYQLWSPMFYKENYQPLRVIFDNPYTIIEWQDHSKTVVRAGEGEPFSEEVGFAMAVLKKLYGLRANYLKIIKERSYTRPVRVTKPKKEKVSKDITVGSDNVE